ncbi:MAG: DUF4105 domain-containing protein [Candidatus Paceibacterota bacterium]
MKLFSKPIKKRQVFLYLVLIFIIYIVVLITFRSPSNDRDWSLDQQILPYAEFAGDTVHIKNIRNFEYQSTDSYTPRYYDKTVNLNDLVSVDYIVEPLASVAVAHTLLSFGFSDGSRVAISVEIRKEKGEEFSPFKGLIREYELMYVIVDERDVLTLRAVHRNNPVYIYPTKATPEVAKKLFVDMIQRANKLKVSPEFYNTLTSTCTTNIADHINKITDNRIPWDMRLLLPKNSDQLAYELGLINTDTSLEQLRSKYEASESIKNNLNEPNFSYAIRKDLHKEN